VDEPVHPPQPDRADPSRDSTQEDPVEGSVELGLDGVDPALDPVVEDQVRALLAGAPDPGPMPDAVAVRISAAIAEEALLRVDPGPLATPGSAGAQGMPDSALGGHVVNLPNRPDRPRPLYLAAAVAAAAAVVAVGASALHATQRPIGTAVVGDGLTSSVPSSPVAPPATPSPTATSGTVHIQLSTTAYDAGTLASGARQLLDHPAAPVPDLTANASSLGPVATPIGLGSCLAALGVSNPAAVSADLATFDGRPAAIVVVTRDGAATAWAVARSCTEGSPGILKDATPVP
jgi:hypothetical protein